MSYFRKGEIKKLTKPFLKHRNSFTYLCTTLRNKEQHEVASVHLLVAKAFIPNPNNYPVVNHIDGNKFNNNVDNLEWVTYRDNNIHALEHHLRQPRGSPIVQLDSDGNFIKEYRSVSEAARQSLCNRSSISHCVNKRTASQMHKGFKWVYKSDFLHDDTYTKVQRLNSSV